jgi:hypothetical protein
MGLIGMGLGWLTVGGPKIYIIQITTKIMKKNYLNF